MMDTTLYLIGQQTEDGDLRVPLASHTLLFIAQYCKQRDLQFVFVKDDEHHETFVRVPGCALKGLYVKFTKHSSLSLVIRNVTLPIVCNNNDGMICSGLCNTARRIIFLAHCTNPEHGYLDLLGFREGSCKACAEMSGWTKLCEVELPTDLEMLIFKIRSWYLFDRLNGDHRQNRQNSNEIELPLNLMKLEEHFKKPPLVHNYNKIKTKLLKTLKQEKTIVAQWIIDENLISDCGMIEFQREQFCLHWTLKYHVMKPVVSNACQPDILSLKNLSLREKSEAVNCKQDILHRNKGHKDNETLLEAVVLFIESLNVSDIHFEHLYSEGILMTVADILLFPYIFLFLESTNFSFDLVSQFLPKIEAWFHRMLSLKKIQEASSDVGFNIEKLNGKETVQSLHSKSFLKFTGPCINQDTGNDLELSRVRKTKFKALKPEVTETLVIFETSKLSPVLGEHPAGEKTALDWERFPSAVHPREGGLPKKRQQRKCQQIECLVTAVLKIAKTGNIIVDFCSGGGHLGIVIAYLLPDCQVYLIDNKEQSLLGAQKRITELGLKNITLYQCNVHYFHGHFDIGVCLHACGVATDMVQEQCLNNNASFVICPCCYGSVRNTHVIKYPRSETFKNKGITDKDLITIGHAADQTEIDIKLQEQGKYCMNLVDTDRLHSAQEKGYQVVLCSLKPLSCTTKNNLLIGVR